MKTQDLRTVWWFKQLFNFWKIWCQAIRFLYVCFIITFSSLSWKITFPKYCIIEVLKEITLEKKISHLIQFFSVSLCEKKNIFPINGNFAHCLKKCVFQWQVWGPFRGKVQNLVIALEYATNKSYLTLVTVFYIW